MDPYLFQYCPKIVVLSADGTKVLLAKRQGELDYDGVYSFIGGKMETTDTSIIAALKREKDEEIGADFKIRILPSYSFNVLFTKQSGQQMIVPHCLAYHVSGDVVLSDEYSDWQWISLQDLAEFEPKIENISEMVQRATRLASLASDTDFVTI
jgi:8-oxo-dGTP pyrophosphatase MutT (NUDIX family)